MRKIPHVYVTKAIIPQHFWSLRMHPDAVMLQAMKLLHDFPVHGFRVQVLKQLRVKPLSQVADSYHTPYRRVNIDKVLISRILSPQSATSSAVRMSMAPP